MGVEASVHRSDRYAFAGEPGIGVQAGAGRQLRKRLLHPAAMPSGLPHAGPRLLWPAKFAGDSAERMLDTRRPRDPNRNTTWLRPAGPCLRNSRTRSIVRVR